MKIISFAGRKGGTGKTTNSHAAAHGLVMLGIPAAYVLTDRRQLPSDEKRVYSVIDGRTTSQLEQAVTTAQAHDGAGVLVIDGGGNREAVDDLLNSVSDAVFLPFGASDDDVTTIAEDMALFPTAWALPSNWPNNSKAAAIDRGYIDKLAELYPHRLLAKLPATHAIRDLVLQDFNGLLLPPAQRYCKALGRQVFDVLKL
jgi:chromosome partitioning protein